MLLIKGQTFSSMQFNIAFEKQQKLVLERSEMHGWLMCDLHVHVCMCVCVFSVPALHSACAGQQAGATQALLLLGLGDTPDTSGTTAQQIARKRDVLAAFDSHGPQS